jgi:hypothetical protein
MAAAVEGCARRDDGGQFRRLGMAPVSGRAELRHAASLPGAKAGTNPALRGAATFLATRERRVMDCPPSA